MTLAAPAILDMRLMLLRGALGRCPKCGKGKLFRAYLKQVDQCAVCFEDYKHIRADDAPPWATILLTGHIVVPALLIVETWNPWAPWVSMLVWPLVICLLALTILPRAKGLFIALIWATRAPGSERDQTPLT